MRRFRRVALEKFVFRFDAYVDNNWNVELGNAPVARKVDLSYMSADLSAELLYEKLEAQEKPEFLNLKSELRKTP